MLNIFEVLKFEKLTETKEEHPKNIEPIEVTFEESKCDKSISVIFSQLLNIL